MTWAIKMATEGSRSCEPLGNHGLSFCRGPFGIGDQSSIEGLGMLPSPGGRGHRSLPEDGVTPGLVDLRPQDGLEQGVWGARWKEWT